MWTSNIRGLHSNLSDLSIQVATDKPDIICLTETFLPQDVSDSQVSLPGYSLHRYDRPEPCPGGRVALFTKDSSSLSMHCPHSPTPPGIPLATASPPLPPHVICVLNHPPNSDDSIYNSLSENMDQLLSSHPNSLFLICGDFNCHHASWLGVGTSLTCHSNSAKAFCNSLGLTQSVNFPTRISTNGTPLFWI